MAAEFIAVAGWCEEHQCPTIPHEWSSEGDSEFGEECWLAVYTSTPESCSSRLGKAAVYRKVEA